MKPDKKILDVLQSCTIDRSRDGRYLLTIPGQLDRANYLKLNQVFEEFGGKWDRKTKKHIFSTDPGPEFSRVFEYGEVPNKKKEFQFFETPRDIVILLIHAAQAEKTDKILEPSAGKAAIASPLRTLGYSIDCIELEESNREYLIGWGFNLVGNDFLTTDIEHGKYDIIIANPPFSKKQEIAHVSKMIDIAGRRVVSIMSTGILHNTDRETVILREKILMFGGEIKELPTHSFRESGTCVNTCMVTVDTNLAF